MPSSYQGSLLGPLARQTLFLKQLPKLYIGALSLIAAFALTGQVLIQTILFQQAYDGHVISLAANQETLSQRVSKDALAIALTTDRRERTHYLDQFTTVALTWNRVHLGLQHGDPGLQLPRNTDSVIAQQFRNLEPQYQGILHAALDVLKFVKAYKVSHPADPVGFSVPPLVPDVRELLTQEEPFAQGMEGIVARFEEIAATRVITVRITEFALCAFTLSVLILEGTFIFAPAVRKLKHNAADLQQAEQQLAKNAEMLQERNEHLQLALQEVWAIRRKKLLPVHVVSPGQYRVLNSAGDHFYMVKARSTTLVCECYVGQQTGVCSHIVAASAVHSAVLRSQQRSAGVRPLRSLYA